MDKTPDPGLARGSPVIPLTPVSGLRTPRRTGPSSPSSPSSWDSISVLFAMPFCPEHWLAVPQDAPQCGFVGSPSDRAQSGHASEAGTPQKLCTEGPLLLPLTVPCTPDVATSRGLPEASEHLWAQDTGARLRGQPGFPPVSDVSGGMRRTSWPALLLGQRDGWVDQGPFPGGRPHPLWPPVPWSLCPAPLSPLSQAFQPELQPFIMAR